MSATSENLRAFASWAEVLAYAKTGADMFYHAPLDARPVCIRQQRRGIRPMIRDDDWTQDTIIDSGEWPACPYCRRLTLSDGTCLDRKCLRFRLQMAVQEKRLEVMRKARRAA